MSLLQKVSSVLDRIASLVKLNHAWKTYFLQVMKTTRPLVLVVPEVIMAGP